MAYINFSDDDIYRANTVNLAAYLESKGDKVKKIGSVKADKLRNSVNECLNRLKMHSQTASGLKVTARKLYDIADCALRLATEETLTKRAVQKKTPEEETSDESFQMSMSV